MVRMVPVELKLATNHEQIEAFVPASLPQVTQYTISRGRSVGVLAVLDVTDRPSPTPRLLADGRVYRGETTAGLSPADPVAIVALIIRGAMRKPSALLAAREPS